MPGARSRQSNFLPEEVLHIAQEGLCCGFKRGIFSESLGSLGKIATLLNNGLTYVFF